MAYNENVPLANQTIAETQQPIHDNFADIETLLLVNHVGFNVADQGKHKFVTLPSQVVDPIPAPFEINVFSRLSTYTAQTELCVARDSGEVIEMTSSFQDPTGWAFTSSGLLLKWGLSTANPGGTNIAYPVGADKPVFGAVFNVMITTQYPSGMDENTIVNLVASSPTFFTVVPTQRTITGPSLGPVNFYYFAVGRL